MPYEPYLPATDMPRFLRELAEFVGLDDGDVAAIHRTAPLVLARESALTAALYDHFLKFPASASAGGSSAAKASASALWVRLMAPTMKWAGTTGP